PDLDQDQGERDRDAEPPFEDVVQVAVARIRIVLGVAGEALLLEEALAKAVELAERVAGPRDARAPLERLEPIQIRLRAEPRVRARPRRCAAAAGGPGADPDSPPRRAAGRRCAR